MTNEADGNPEQRGRRAVRRKRSPPARAGQAAISGEGAGRGAPPADGRARAARARQAGPRVDHRRVGSAGGVKALPAPLPADFLHHPGHFASHSLLVAHYSALSISSLPGHILYAISPSTRLGTDPEQRRRVSHQLLCLGHTPSALVFKRPESVLDSGTINRYIQRTICRTRSEL